MGASLPLLFLRASRHDQWCVSHFSSFNHATSVAHSSLVRSCLKAIMIWRMWVLAELTSAASDAQRLLFGRREAPSVTADDDGFA